MFLPTLISTLGLVTIAFFFLASWLYKINNRKHEIAIEAKTQRFNKIIDKFDTPQELMDFLKSEQGLKALDTLTTSQSMVKIPLLVSISAGIIITCSGMGSFVLMAIMDQDLIFPATGASSIGIGFLIASSISYYLSKKWGLLEGTSPGVAKATTMGEKS